MKSKQEIKTTCKKVVKNKKVYYNINLEVEGMKFQVEPKFLNAKQKALLKHKLARLMGDENNAKK